MVACEVGLKGAMPTDVIAVDRAFGVDRAAPAWLAPLVYALSAVITSSAATGSSRASRMLVDVPRVGSLSHGRIEDLCTDPSRCRPNRPHVEKRCDDLAHPQRYCCEFGDVVGLVAIMLPVRRVRWLFDFRAALGVSSRRGVKSRGVPRSASADHKIVRETPCELIGMMGY